MSTPDYHRRTNFYTLTIINEQFLTTLFFHYRHSVRRELHPEREYTINKCERRSGWQREGTIAHIKTQ